MILIGDTDYPGYCRVELLDHIKEMTDLTPLNRARMMKVVFAVETVLRELLNPDKINLASLGNKTPHVHWHVIPRFDNDKHFPNSHWGEVMRECNAIPLNELTINILAENIKVQLQCALSTSAS